MKKKKIFRERPRMGRIPTAPAIQTHRDKTKYFRKEKHSKKEDNA